MQEFDIIIGPLHEGMAQNRDPHEIKTLLTEVRGDVVASFANEPSGLEHAELYLDALLHTAAYYGRTRRRANLGIVAMTTALDGPPRSDEAESAGLIVRALIGLYMLPTMQREDAS